MKEYSSSTTEVLLQYTVHISRAAVYFLLPIFVAFWKKKVKNLFKKNWLPIKSQWSNKSVQQEKARSRKISQSQTCARVNFKSQERKK